MGRGRQASGFFAHFTTTQSSACVAARPVLGATWCVHRFFPSQKTEPGCAPAAQRSTLRRVDTTIAAAVMRGVVLAGWDLATVGLWHPGLMAWRMSHSAGTVWRAPRFGDRLVSRRTGQPGQAFSQGDTPWSVLAQVAAWAGLRPGDTFVDVGAGQGMAAAVLSTLTGAAGYAVEPLAELRAEGALAAKALGLPVTTVAALEEVPLAACRAAFGAWTCLDAPSRAALVGRLAQLPQGAVLVTVTHPAAGDAFALQRSVTRMFPWGRAELHIQRRT
jgi:hypothetical protein